MDTTKHTISESEQYILNGTFFKSKNEHSNKTIVYFHGGGLIFGTKNDLPNEYVNLITEEFNLFSVNYRLVPESDLNDIFEDLSSIYDYTKKKFTDEIYVLGRSAGGYLSYLFSKHFEVFGAFILYGYYDFKHRDFMSLPKDQVKFAPMLSSSIEKQNVKFEVITEALPNPRFLLYLYYRNESLWQKKLGVNLEDDKYFLTDEDLKRMPKTVLVHSNNDPDVPFDYSKHASTLIPECKFIELDKNTHDFDQTVTDETLQIYREAIEFLA